MESITMETKNTPEEKEVFIQQDKSDMSEYFREKICAEFCVVAEPGRAREFAEEETQRVLDLLRYSIPALHPIDHNISVGLQGEVSRGLCMGIIFSANSNFFQFASRKVGSIGNFNLTPENIQIMEGIGVFGLSEILKKPSGDLTDFEDTILRGVHWFSNSQTQSERESGFLNLIVCLETFLTPKDGSPIGGNIAEGVAIILEQGLEKRKDLKKKMKKLYGMRSAVSHGGRKAILDTDLMSLKCIAWTLTKQMIGWRDRFDSRDSLLSWIEDRKLE